MRGLKTLLASGIIVLVGLADELGGIDLQGAAAKVFSEDQAARVGKWLVILSVVFAVLRVVTKGPVAKSTPSSADVDDPEAET